MRPPPSAPTLRSKAGVFLLVSALAVLVSFLVAACSSGGPPGLGDGINPNNGTDGGTMCATPAAGCPCGTAGQQVECGEVEVKDQDGVTCSMGHITCGSDGTWGQCIGDHIVYRSAGPIGDLVTLGLGSQQTCQNNPCDPDCQMVTDDAGGLDAGNGLTQADGGGLTLLQGEGGVSCVGLQCQVAKCDGGAGTTLTGTVYDPAGLDPVYHANVYVPAQLPLPAIPQGAQKDPCGGGGNLPPAVSYALTGPDGKFTLTGVPSGSNIPLVVQAGKWRRMVMLSTVNQCTTTALPASKTRLPQNATDGYNSQADLPHIALVSGSCDPMECLIKRIGVSTSEFKDPGAGGHVDYYQAYGEPLNGGSNPKPTNLLSNLSTMMTEDLVMLPCDCGEEYYPYRYSSGRWSGNYTTFMNNIGSYTADGGRLFSSHWGRQWIEGGGAPNPFPGVASFIPYWSSGGYDSPWYEGQVNTSFQKGLDFANWMQTVGASTTFGKLLINPSRYDTYSVVSPTQSWVDFTGRYTWDGVNYYSGRPDYPADITFNTPVNTPPASQYGRVMFTDMHLASGFDSYSFPSECPSGGLTPQEKAAEFLLFDLGACLQALPPPPPIWFNPATFSRDFTAQCPAGKVVKWRWFNWQDETPSDSNIVFDAQTGPNVSSLGANVALATVSGAPNLVWTGVDVNPKLVAAGQSSQAVLRVNMTLNPSSDHLQAPTLLAWQQTFDCVDSL